MEISAIVAAAGRGTRIGGVNKALLEIKGKPAISYCLEVFLKLEFVKEVIVVTNSETIDLAGGVFRDSRIVTIRGGEERSQSVRNGVLNSRYPFVLVHDVARPFITKDFVKKIVESFESTVKGVIPGVAVKPTIKTVRADRVIKTLSRELLREIQTPQLFEKAALEEAYQKLDIRGITDEAYLIELLGFGVKCVEGLETNIKITTKLDLEVAERLAEKWTSE